MPILEAVEDAAPRPPEAAKPILLDAVRPVLFVRNVRAAAEFYRDRLGLRVDFLHGHPPFHGSVSRADAALHLRFVHEPVLAADTAREYLAAGVELAQKLTKHAWGGTDFTVRQLDGNTVAFVG